MAATDPIVEIQNASAYRQDIQAFEGLSLKIHSGEKVAILGPNGSGKSTLLKLISRDIYPVDRPGSFVKLYGSDTVNLWELRQKIGLVSHDLQEDYTPYSTGREVVLSGFFGAIGAHEHLHATEAQVEAARAAIAALGISELEQRMYQRMSTGQQRRFLVARALIHDPELIIFDEPTTGLDIGASFKLLETMRSLCQQQRSLLIATHHVEEIIPEVERVLLLANGQIIADGAKQAVLSSENLSGLYGVPIEVIEQGGWYRLQSQRTSGGQR